MPKNNNHNRNNGILPNPFSPQYPADPKYFADRHEHLEYFTKTIMSSAKIRPPAPSNFMILGDWGMGKTSLLVQDERSCIERIKRQDQCLLFPFFT